MFPLSLIFLCFSLTSSILRAFLISQARHCNILCMVTFIRDFSHDVFIFMHGVHYKYSETKHLLVKQTIPVMGWGFFLLQTQPRSNSGLHQGLRGVRRSCEHRDILEVADEDSHKALGVNNLLVGNRSVHVLDRMMLVSKCVLEIKVSDVM